MVANVYSRGSGGLEMGLTSIIRYESEDQAMAEIGNIAAAMQWYGMANNGARYVG